METRFISCSIYYNQRYRGCAAGAKSELSEDGFIETLGGNYSMDDIIEHYPDRPIYRMGSFRVGDDHFYAYEIDHKGNQVQPGNAVGPMFGGNFVYSSDSRFPFDYPLGIHDRFESQEAYETLSR